MVGAVCITLQLCLQLTAAAVPQGGSVSQEGCCQTGGASLLLLLLLWQPVQPAEPGEGAQRHPVGLVLLHWVEAQVQLLQLRDGPTACASTKEVSPCLQLHWR